MSHSDPAPSSSGALRTIVLILLPVLGIILAVAIALLVRRPTDRADVAVIVTGEEAAAAINTGDVIDATGRAPGLVPRLGYRYKVFIDDESEDRTSGIAKIGGLVTFIPGTRPGQTAIIDITRVRERVADGLLVAVLSEVDLPPKAPRTPYAPRPGDVTAHVVAGAEMDVVITEASSRNPDTEGVARISGLVVFVYGATTIGERVNIRITERRERVAFAEPTGQPAGTGPLPAGEIIRRAFTPQPSDPAAHVVAGAEMDVVITEASSKNPDTEGVARIKGLVVFVEGATTIGERVNVRITERRERMAFAEVTGNPPGTGPLPEAEARHERVPRGSYVPPAGDATAHVVAGAEMDVVITEASSRNPDTEGVARIKGLVVFVKGVTTIGERVNVRIIERRERMAFAEVTGNPPGTGPLPEAEAPHERVPRGSYVPPAGDATAHVVAGAEMDVVITEASSRNPDTEGVARIKGLVVFVKGVTTIGERVNVRITERRERVAMAEPTGQPAGHERLPAPTAAPRPPAVPVTADARDAVPHLVPGAVIATTILEPSTRNPDTEGLAKIDGFVIFVKGATTPGQAVNVRITERRRTVAMGEVTTDPATVAPASAPPATAPETP